MIATLVGTFLTAVMISFGHCLGMCGGFVLAYNLKLKNKSALEAFFCSLTYHLSRICCYTILGAIFGVFGAAFVFSDSARGYIYFFIGIFMIVLGIALIRRGRLLAFFENDKIWNLTGAKFFKRAASSNGRVSFAVLGFLNGLIPCGVVYSFLAAAIMSQSAINGALTLLVFGLGTLPVLLVLSQSANFLSGEFKKGMLILSAGVIIVYGIYNSYVGYMGIGG